MGSIRLRFQAVYPTSVVSVDRLHFYSAVPRIIQPIAAGRAIALCDPLMIFSSIDSLDLWVIGDLLD